MFKLAKSIILFIILFLSVTSIIGQIIFRGQVINEKKKPVEYATVLLLKATDSSLIKTCISDSLGNFYFINISSADYILNISSISHRDTLIPVTISTNNFKVFTLNDESEVELKNVVITTKKNVVEVKPDRIVFHPTNLISTAGNNAFEILKKAPLVSANEDGNIAVRGVMGTGVMINGRLLQTSREQIMDYLKSITAEDIQKIEIITNPSAKYDAQGLSGLVNIILNKSKKFGLNGNASAYGLQSTYFKYGANVDMNYRSNSINVFGGSTIKAGKYFSLEQVDNIYNRSIDPYSYYETGKRYRDKISTLNKLGIDYKIDKNNVVGIKLESNYAYNDGTERNNALFTKGNFSTDSFYQTHIQYKNNNHSYAVNLNYQGQLDTLGKVLSIDADYYTYVLPILSTMTSSERFNSQSQKIGQDIIFKNQLNERIQIYSVKADYSQPISSTLTFEAGTKIYHLTTNNDIGFYYANNNTLIIDSLKSNRFRYNESNIAAYANFNKQFNVKWSVQAGLRVEQTNIKGQSHLNGQDVKQDYLRLFPSLFLQYNQNENSQFALNYTKRINRPGFDNLNPFKYYSTPNSYTEGNPFLQPSVSNSIELSFTAQQKFYFNLFVYLTKHEIAEVPILDATSNAYKYSSVNLNNSYNYGFVAYLPFEIKPWWQSSYSLTAGVNGVKSQINDIQYIYDRFNIQIQTNQEFTLFNKQKIYAEVNMTYQPSGVTQGLYVLGTYFDCALSLKKVFKDDRSVLSFNVADLFNKAYIPSKIDRPEAYSLTYGNYDMRSIRLSFSYKFGKNSISKSRETKSAIDDEKNRIK